MRFAETSGSRAMIAVSAISVFALIAASWDTAAPAPSHQPRPVHAMRGCNQAKQRVIAPPVESPRNGHADTLIGARDALSECMRDRSVPVRLALDISATGKVTSVEVKALTDDLAKIDMHVVQCLQHAASPLVFPRGTAPVRISTHLAPR
ncbi:MAG: hypothetical protein H0T42_03585 [Deltaproteobacteria bacterium]|nr:hypothetical protein [Deltaproteobacteria bacterium]